MNLFPRLSLAVGLLSLAACGSTPAAPNDAGVTTDQRHRPHRQRLSRCVHRNLPRGSSPRGRRSLHLRGAVRCWGVGGDPMATRPSAATPAPVRW